MRDVIYLNTRMPAASSKKPAAKAAAAKTRRAPPPKPNKTATPQTRPAAAPPKKTQQQQQQQWTQIVNGPPQVVLPKLKVASERINNNKRPVLVLVYSNGCSFCQQFKPEWDTFARNHVPDNMEVVDIDTSALMMPSQGTNVLVDTVRDGYSGAVPYVVMIMNDGSSPEQYNGARTSDALRQFVAHRMGGGGKSRATKRTK